MDPNILNDDQLYTNSTIAGTGYPDDPVRVANPGLTVVNHDGTLTGNGRVDNPLSVTNPGITGITVEEVDGVPTVFPVTTIVVPNGTLTDDGAGQVTFTPASSGSSLEVTDGTTDVTDVTKINFPSGSVTDDTGGEVSIAFSGSGSPGGVDTNVQFNDSGSFGGENSLTFDKTSFVLKLDADFGNESTFTGGDGNLFITTDNEADDQELLAGNIFIRPGSADIDSAGAGNLNLEGGNANFPFTTPGNVNINGGTATAVNVNSGNINIKAGTVTDTDDDGVVAGSVNIEGGGYFDNSLAGVITLGDVTITPGQIISFEVAQPSNADVIVTKSIILKSNSGADISGLRPGTDNGPLFILQNLDGNSPPSTPTGGGKLYVENGELKYIGSAGTVTTIAPD